MDGYYKSIVCEIMSVKKETRKEKKYKKTEKMQTRYYWFLEGVSIFSENVIRIPLDKKTI